MLERYDVIGRRDGGDPLMVHSRLPDALFDQQRLDEKLKRDRQKLYTMVEYANWEGDRKAFIHRYFGLVE